LVYWILHDKVCEITRLKLLLCQRYPQDAAGVLLHVFLDNYTPPHGDLKLYFAHEKALYAWFALISVNGAAGKPELKQQLRDFQTALKALEALAALGWELN